jgi:hypothetical protein
MVAPLLTGVPQLGQKREFSGRGAEQDLQSMICQYIPPRFENQDVISQDLARDA